MVIKLGNFFFRWRDTLFSLILLFGLYSLTMTQQYWFLLGFGSLKEDIVFSMIGFLLVLIGITIRSITIGYIYIKRAGINKKIHADQLFKEGLFAHSRNPLYLGNLFIVTGAIMSLNLILFWVLILPMFYLIYYAIIRAEEAFLSNKFKQEYLEYLNQVPRLFFGNFHLFPDSFKNLNFSLKRVIKVEHSVQFLVLFTIVLTNILKFHFRYNINWENEFLIVLYIILVILIIYQILASILKRLGKLD